MEGFVVSVCTLMYCGQTVGCIKMPLGTEVGLGPGHIVLDGKPAPRGQEHTRPPLFGPCLLWPNGRPSQLLSCCFCCFSDVFCSSLVPCGRLSLTVSFWAHVYKPNRPIAYRTVSYAYRIFFCFSIFLVNLAVHLVQQIYNWLPLSY